MSSFTHLERFHYFSSADVLCLFINLNHRIQQLICKRGFFHRLNLSSASLYQFDTLLALVINIEVSPLQLSRFPHLPHLTTLRLCFETNIVFAPIIGFCRIYHTADRTSRNIRRGYSATTEYTSLAEFRPELRSGSPTMGCQANRISSQLSSTFFATNTTIFKPRGLQ
ncbi:unnamed protein product [Adineta ricciae]|uniref:Uncharacterized protein n=1 Tax=Adineta ricciae TaxID=249248 RepID=A0A813QDN4_ADIRI|nr:unnamed protein product [Adineta ricciae]